MSNFNFKQSLRLLKSNPVISLVGIVGTALAICLVMISFISYRVEKDPIYPEVNRDRTLYIKGVRVTWKDTQQKGHGHLSQHFAENYIKPLQTPEVISIFFPLLDKAMVSEPGKSSRFTAHTRYVDDDYWKVFEFKFVEGAPFTHADFESGLPKAVISESVAKRLTGSSKGLVGKEIQLDYKPFTVVGVVKDAPEVALDTYSDIWYPYSAKANLPTNSSDKEFPSGSARAALLAKSKKEFSKIRQEVDQMVERFNNNENCAYTIYFMGAPDNYYTHQARVNGTTAPDVKGMHRRLLALGLILLIVPAINLSTMISSSINKRLSEQGIRRTYGATRQQLIKQVVSESFIQTLLGGILGLIFSVIAIYAFTGLFVSGDFFVPIQSGDHIPLWNLISLRSILFLLLFCFVLNLLATLLPAIRYSRKPIVKSLILK